MRVKPIVQVKAEVDIGRYCDTIHSRMRTADEFWEEVKVLCRMIRLTYGALSIALGRSPNYVTNMSSNKAIPTVMIAVMIASVFGMSVEELVLKG